MTTSDLYDENGLGLSLREMDEREAEEQGLPQCSGGHRHTAECFGYESFGGGARR